MIWCNVQELTGQLKSSKEAHKSAFIGVYRRLIITLRGIGLLRHIGFGAPMHTDERRFDLLTERVLGAIFDVSNTLGAGFLEKVYQRALLTELRLRGAHCPAIV